MNTLRRFWFPATNHFGVGVTALSEAEARDQAREVAVRFGWQLSGQVVADVDVRDLDQRHVIPNMGPPNVRGIWYPNLNMPPN